MKILRKIFYDPESPFQFPYDVSTGYLRECLSTELDINILLHRMTAREKP